ncbi:MAG: hypothetical protein WC551_13245 [Patescibacteria group bacterium]
MSKHPKTLSALCENWMKRARKILGMESNDNPWHLEGRLIFYQNGPIVNRGRFSVVMFSKETSGDKEIFAVTSDGEVILDYGKPMLLSLFQIRMLGALAREVRVKMRCP